MLHAQVKPTTFATKEAFNKDYGTSWISGLNTYGSPHSYHPTVSFLTYTPIGNSKLATVLYTKALQTRLTAESVPITCVTLHPGATNTSGAGKLMGEFPILGWFFKNYVLSLALGTWRSGAMTVAFAAAGKEVATEREKYRGAYLVPVGKIGAASRYALDMRLQTELYESTEKFIKEMV
jgi:NAD(P)-dependent dehydrogenase (short-subunit alcohol dehydrogenase family)